MKNIIFVLLLIGGAFSGCDNKTVSERAEETTNDAKRGTKKTMNRIDEKLCAESDLECLSEKAKHRAEEGADYVEDKAEETVD